MHAYPRRFYLPLSLAAASVALALLGCGDGKTEIQGVATWNGTPIEEGYVELSPTDGQGQVVGADVKNGAFVLRTLPGEKQVSVVANKKIGEADTRGSKPIIELSDRMASVVAFLYFG